MQTWIRKYIPNSHRLDNESIVLANSAFHERVHSRGHSLLRKGQTCDKLYFIISGLIYAYDENGRILWYESEGASFTDVESFYSQVPSNICIKIAENDTRLVSISFCELEHLFKTSHQWACWGIQFYQLELQRIVGYYEALRTKDASQRYFELLNAHPGILQRIPLGHIASYLGISQVSLSRIRAGVQKQ